MTDSTRTNVDRDRLDDKLIADGNYAELLATYYPVVISRLLLRMDERTAHEVASLWSVRLLSELTRGRRYVVPFRVVVWKVTQWSLKDHYAESRRPNEVSLPEDLDPAVEPETDQVAGNLWVQQVINRHLAGRQREVAWLYFVEGLSPQQIADRLGITRNAVDQALHNAIVKLRRLVGDV